MSLYSFQAEPEVNMLSYTEHKIYPDFNERMGPKQNSTKKNEQALLISKLPF